MNDIRQPAGRDTPMVTLGVDVGGTFTDAVVVIPPGAEREAGVYTGKQPTTPEDQSIGAVEAALDALAAAGLPAAAVGRFVHGMTVTTNAMLEGEFARTALLATAGFTDIEELARQNRASLYRLCQRGPAPIVPPALRFPVSERCTPDGVLVELDEAALERTIAGLARYEVESVAVCLLFSFLHPRHEQRVGEMLAKSLPDVHVTLSHEAVGTFREYERCATTVAAAALAPKLASYMRRLRERAAAAGLPEPLVMLGNGGVCPASTAASRAAHTVLSGPAGGAVGVAAHAAGGAGERLLVGFDMGGTSTDVCVVEEGRIRVRSARSVAGRPLALAAADIATVGAGGGSVAWCDSGGALRVGPRSAGARPGPAAYGHGGSEPTVTDANLMLGYLGAENALAGGLRLDIEAARESVERLAGQLGTDPVQTAAGILEVADLEMTRATMAMTVARGIDPRGHTLVAFGGAGPMHAARVAERLGIGHVLCPDACGVLSALGLALAGHRSDATRSAVRALDDVSAAELEEMIGELWRRAHDETGGVAGAVREATCELRYRGQSFELPVDAPPGVEPATLAERFHAEHEREFGWCQPGGAVELVTVRASALTASTPLPDAGPERGNDRAAWSTRRAWFDGEWRETRVARAARASMIEVGPTEDGPLIVELPQATIVVPPGWRARAGARGVTLSAQPGDGGSQ